MKRDTVPNSTGTGEVELPLVGDVLQENGKTYVWTTRTDPDGVQVSEWKEKIPVVYDYSESYGGMFWKFGG